MFTPGGELDPPEQATLEYLKGNSAELTCPHSLACDARKCFQFLRGDSPMSPVSVGFAGCERTDHHTPIVHKLAGRSDALVCFKHTRDNPYQRETGLFQSCHFRKKMLECQTRYRRYDTDDLHPPPTAYNINRSNNRFVNPKTTSVALDCPEDDESLTRKLTASPREVYAAVSAIAMTRKAPQPPLSYETIRRSTHVLTLERNKLHHHRKQRYKEEGGDELTEGSGELVNSPPILGIELHGTTLSLLGY